MPIFRALKACRDAMVIHPDFAKYAAVSRLIRALTDRLTPLLQPLSVDEAALHMAGAEAHHGAPLAAVLAGSLVADPSRETKSISAETTFDANLSRIEELEHHLWRLTDILAHRLKKNDLAAGGVVLKLKIDRCTTRTRAARLPGATMLPDRLFDTARVLLAREATGAAFRLIGIGASPLVAHAEAGHGDLPDRDTPRLAAADSGRHVAPAVR